MNYEQDAAASRRWQRITQRKCCGEENAQRFTDPRDEGYSSYMTSVVAGLADLHDYEE